MSLRNHDDIPQGCQPDPDPMRKSLFLSILVCLAAQPFPVLAADAANALIPEERIQAAAVKQFEEINRTHAPAMDQAFSKKAACVAKALINAIPAEQADARISWSVHIYENSEVNVSALPSGHILINSGLAKSIRNADELASAIATPISSAVLKHAHKKLIRRMLAQPGSSMSGLPFSQQAAQQKQEEALALADTVEADALGRLIMKKAGFDPRAQLSLLEALASGKPLLQPHYGPRISASQAWLEQHAADGAPAAKPCALLQ